MSLATDASFLLDITSNVQCTHVAHIMQLCNTSQANPLQHTIDSSLFASGSFGSYKLDGLFMRCSTVKVISLEQSLGRAFTGIVVGA